MRALHVFQKHLWVKWSQTQKVEVFAIEMLQNLSQLDPSESQK